MGNTVNSTSTTHQVTGPPGSGKSTYLLQQAISTALASGHTIPPQGIRFLTVTPAQQQQLTRWLHTHPEVKQLDTTRITVQTLDSFCLEFLKEYAFALTLPDTTQTLPAHFKLLSDLQAQFLIRHLGQQYLDTHHPAQPHPLHFVVQSWTFTRQLYRLFSQFLAHDVTPDILEQAEAHRRLPFIRTLYQQFLTQTRSQGLLIYPDLPVLFCHLLQSRPDIHRQITDRLHTVFVDDAQELSPIQYQQFTQLNPDVNLVFAGCPTLSIRQNRGASPNLFQHLGDAPSKTQLPADDAVHSPVQSALSQFLSPWLAAVQPESSLPLTQTSLAADTTDILGKALQFNLAHDAAEEVHTLVNALIEGGPSRHDTAILIPSLYHPYLPLLLTTLSETNIPVLLQNLPQSIHTFQNHLFHVLSALCQWEILFQQGSLETITRQEAQQALYQHIYHWLCALPNMQSDTQLLGYLHQLSTDPTLLSTLASPLASPLADLTTSPDLQPESQARITHFLDGFMDLYEAYCKAPPGQKIQQATWLLIQQEQWLHTLSNNNDPTIPDQAVFDAISKLLKSLANFEDNITRLSSSSMSLADLLSQRQHLWLLDPNPAVDHHPDSTPNILRILTYHQAQGLSFDRVFIPFLTEGTPQSTSEPQLFTHAERDSLKALLTDANTAASFLDPDPYQAEAASATHLAHAISRAKTCAILSAHTHTETHQEDILPASSFVQLQHRWQQLTGLSIHTSTPSDSPALEASESDPSSHDKTPWLSLPQQADQPVFDGDDSLALSPSSIHDYMKCPRKFYYKNLLKLPEPSSGTASLGLIIHRLMEVFNKTATPETYTSERLTTLAQQYFDFENHQPDLLALGFEDSDFRTLGQLDQVTRHDLHLRLMKSLEDLTDKGYFEPGIQTVLAEEGFFGVSLPELPNCQLNAKLDALLQRPGGAWDIVDYKFYQDPTRFSVKTEDKRVERLLNVFTPIDADAESHSERFKTTESKPRDYQLPLYYLLAKQDARFSQNIGSVALQLVRPPLADGNGAVRIPLTPDQLEKGLPQLVSDLNQYIVNPVLATDTFEIIPTRSCLHCAYFPICPSNGSEENEDSTS